MTFENAGVFATALEVAARVHRQRAGVQVVGLSCAPPLTTVPHHGACGVSSRLDVLRERVVPRRVLHGLVLSFGDADHSVRSDRLRGLRHATTRGWLLDGDRSPDRTPLVGLSSFTPPPTSTARVHSRLCSRESVAFGPGLPRPGLVPPLPFLPASTVCSTHCLAGLLHPAAGPGVRHVSGCCGVVRAVRGFVRFDGVTTTSARDASTRQVGPAAAPSPGCLLLTVGSAAAPGRCVSPRPCRLPGPRRFPAFRSAASPRRSELRGPRLHGPLGRRCRRLRRPRRGGARVTPPPSPFPVAPHPSEPFPRQ